MSLIPIYWWNKEVHNFRISQDKFSKQPWAQGVVLLACVAVAMLLANLPFTKHIYHAVLETQLFAGIKSPDGTIDWNFPRGMTVEKFINDILMVIFFFTVGLEIKARHRGLRRRGGPRRHLHGREPRNPRSERLGHPDGDGHRFRRGHPVHPG